MHYREIFTSLFLFSVLILKGGDLFVSGENSEVSDVVDLNMSGSSSFDANKPKPVHLIVMVHGMWGRPGDMGRLYDILQGKFQSDRYFQANERELVSENDVKPGETTNDDKGNKDFGNKTNKSRTQLFEGDFKVDNEGEETMESFANEDLHQPLIDMLQNQRNVETIIKFSTSNYLLKTYHGVDVCGVRLKNEVKKIVDDLEGSVEDGNNENRRVRYISFIGYSAGGLFARYAIGLLHGEKFFANRSITPLSFITIATPHCGVRDNGNMGSGKIINNLLDTLSYFYVGRSGDHMLLKDASLVPHDQDEVYEPLLLIMSDPKQNFFQALKQFKEIFFYANARRDHTVNYVTASCSSHNKYKLLERDSMTSIETISIPINKNHAQYVKGYNYVKVVSRIDLEHQYERQQQVTDNNSSTVICSETDNTKSGFKGGLIPSMSEDNNSIIEYTNENLNPFGKLDESEQNLETEEDSASSLVKKYGGETVNIKGEVHEKIPSWLYTLIVPLGVLHTTLFFTPIRVFSSVATDWQTQYQHNMLQQSIELEPTSQRKSSFGDDTAKLNYSATEQKLATGERRRNNDSPVSTKEVSISSDLNFKDNLQKKNQNVLSYNSGSDYRDRIPGYIIKNLSLLPIHKVDVVLPTIHTHPTIMVRHPPLDNSGLDVLDHIANLLVYKSTLHIQNERHNLQQDDGNVKLEQSSNIETKVDKSLQNLPEVEKDLVRTTKFLEFMKKKI